MSAEEKARDAQVGELVKVKEGGTVVRPDGITATVHGGHYVLDVPGVFEVDGKLIEAKA